MSATKPLVDHGLPDFFCATCGKNLSKAEREGKLIRCWYCRRNSE